MEDHAFQTAVRASAGVLVVAFGVLLVYTAWPILQPLLVACILAAMLWPWISRLCAIRLWPRGWRLPRPAAAALVYLATFATAGLVIWASLSTLLPALDQLLTQYPQQAAFLQQYLEPFRQGDIAGGAARVVEDVARDASRSQNSAAPQSGGEQQSAPVDASALALGLLGGLLNTGLILVFTFFLLLEGDHFARWGLMLLPRQRRPQMRALGLLIRDRISGWVLATAIYAAFSATFVGLSMWLLQVPSPWLFAIGAAVFAVIPGIGPATLAVPAFLATLTLSTWQPLAILAWGIGYYALDATLIGPKIYGEMLRLPMFVVLLALLIGGVLMGIWGAVLAVPVAVALQLTILEMMGRRPAEEG